MPARGTEVVTNLLRNIADGKRTVFYFHRKLFLFARYNKTNNLRHENVLIARFLPEDISTIFIKDFLIVRPFMTALLKQRSADSVGEFNDYLLVSSRGALDAGDVARRFVKNVRQATTFPLTISLYRHFVNMSFGCSACRKLR